MSQVISPSESGLVLTKAASNLAFAAEALEKAAATKTRYTDQNAPRRGLTRTEAAHYIGLSATSLDSMVKAGTMPKPVRFGSRTVWDIRALDAAFDLIATPDENNAWDT